MRDLLDSVGPSVAKARDTHWVSASREHYDARLKDVRTLTTGLGDGFEAAWKALLRYADAVEEAHKFLDTGTSCAERLGKLVGDGDGEAMKRWEDLRDSSGVVDWVQDRMAPGDVDEIREEANRYYEQASEAFERALRAEESVREDSMKDLAAARALIPDFRSGFKDAAALLDRVGDLRTEAGQARSDPNTHLAGSGTKTDVFPRVGPDVTVSPALRRIRELSADLPEGKDTSYWLPGSSDAKRSEWIDANGAAIRAAAKENGLPPDVIAGIAWREVDGGPGVIDDVTDTARQLGIGGDADRTSMGPMQIQIRRAAEVLGYDPADLTADQRDEVESAVKDPTQNVFIASEYLSRLKAESEFADVPADRMTDAQYQELAARYNGGPYWESDDAQGYGRDFMRDLDSARAAL
ncbi:transglycosylase SLT domain-containing protein [Streptomyces sp. YC537]|uniref:Transglycosylase SLT domain-containing protein n=2 Tax=Streptomyces boluensis TaxID=1775135 RepID=A0A964XLE4_9ACTN|nr:transglycosylase SLT domain-containing protein [Streptomyces boluensis]